MCKNEISAIKDEEGSAALLSSLKWEVLTAKNGDISAREGGAALHSLYNPSREASNAVAQTAVAEKSSALFYGFGLGWQVIEFCKKYPDTK